MTTNPFTVVLVDYDDDLFTPPSWVGVRLAEHGIRWIEGQHRTPETVLAAARDGDVVMIQSVRPLLGRAIIEELHRCRCFVRLGIGYDSIDVEAATQRGIPVCNIPTYCIEDVAEHTLALLMNSVRRITHQDRWIRAGQWDRSGARPTRRMQGCTLGLVGFGRIGRTVARQASGLGLRILVFDPYLNADVVAQHDAEQVTLEALLQNSDFLSVHCPLTSDTHHLLDRKAFHNMKGGVFLVNTSRGPIIDEVALAEALQSGKVWGVGLDVFEQEPLPLDSPLRAFDNVTFTPHVSANSEESVEELYSVACEIAIDVYHGRRPRSVVNPEVEAPIRNKTGHSRH